MKGDAFREMAAQCGELPDSVMAVPGLEYVGEKSAEWEALCVKASAWCAFGPERANGSAPDEWSSAMRYYTQRRFQEGPLIDSIHEFAGLALFARLMAIVTREE
jgi:hypothetical protein